MADPLALLARLERESALLESVAESRTSAPDTALGAVEIDDQLVVSTLIRDTPEGRARCTEDHQTTARSGGSGARS